MRIDRQSFMALDAAAFAKFSPSSARFELGLSYGYIFNKEWTAKLTALTSDVSTMNNWIVCRVCGKPMAIGPGF